MCPRFSTGYAFVCDLLPFTEELDNRGVSGSMRFSSRLARNWSSSMRIIILNSLPASSFFERGDVIGFSPRVMSDRKLNGARPPPRSFIRGQSVVASGFLPCPGDRCFTTHVHETCQKFLDCFALFSRLRVSESTSFWMKIDNVLSDCVRSVPPSHDCEEPPTVVIHWRHVPYQNGVFRNTYCLCQDKS